MADDSAFRERMEIAGAVSQMATEWLWDKRSIHAAGQDYEIADPEDEGYRRGYDAEDMETYVLVRRKSDGAVFEIEIEPLVARAREVKPQPEPEPARGRAGSPDHRGHAGRATGRRLKPCLAHSR